ncbi:hypothetical protein BGZ58_007195 [Dissophora ornata]|nr:hypothetical protein BGZ58_007195 [Dissophora ornata]
MAAAKTTTTAKPKTTTTQTTTSAQSVTTKITSTSASLPSSTSATLQPTATTAPDTSKGGLATPAIIGIAAAGAVLLLFVLSIVICKKRRAYLYAKRDSGHDPSRDPINPNDVLPLETKYNQETPQDDSGFISFPLAALGAGNERGAKPSEQVPQPRQQQTQQRQQTRNQDYQQYDDHIQSHFTPESPELGPRGSPGGPRAPGGRTQIPTPISTALSMDSPRSPPLMSPSQRAQAIQQQQGAMSPRSPRLQQQQQQQSSMDARPRQDNIVNDMGNQFVLHTNNNNNSIERGRDSFDPEGSVVQSEQSYRRPPRKSQDSNVGGGGMGGGVMGGGYPPYNPSGSPSPNALGPQQRGGGGGRPGPNSNGSPYSSPRPSNAQYQPQQPYPQQQPYSQQPYSPQPYSQQPYPQHSPQFRPMYGGPSSPPVYPQQRPAYPGGGSPGTMHPTYFA